MARNRVYENILEVWETLLDARPRNIKNFGHIDLSLKQLKRILTTLIEKEKFKVFYSRETKQYYCNYVVEKIINKSKRCIICHHLKDIEEFNKNSHFSDGRQLTCRICQKQENRDWRKRNKDRINTKQRRWYRMNRKKQIKKSSDYYYENREEILRRKRELYHQKRATLLQED